MIPPLDTIEKFIRALAVSRSPRAACRVCRLHSRWMDRMALAVLE